VGDEERPYRLLLLLLLLLADASHADFSVVAHGLSGCRGRGKEGGRGGGSSEEEDSLREEGMVCRGLARANLGKGRNSSSAAAARSGGGRVRGKEGEREGGREGGRGAIAVVVVGFHA